jgi:hypothetical protein
MFAIACFRTFHAEAERAVDAAVKVVLRQLCQSFGLSHIRDHAGDWLGDITSEQVLFVATYSAS